MKYHAYAIVTGSKYLGEFEADSPEEAEKMAATSDAGYISLCHKCSHQCEDAEVTHITVEPATCRYAN
jgi:hypothetical protein